MQHVRPATVWAEAVVAVALLRPAAIAAEASRTEMIPVAVDAGPYAEFMAGEIQDERDLADIVEIQRRWFNRITPPGISWVQPMFPSVAPFDADGFTESFLDGLLGEDRNSVAVYPLSLALDPKTRETLVHDADGKLIAVLPSDGVSRAWPEDADPARVVLQLDLLPSEDVEPYLYVEGRIAESAEARVAKPERSEGMVLRSLGASEFGFAGAHRLTNGQMRLTATNGTDVAEIYSYTVWHTSTVVVTVWTNEYDEVITSTNLVWDPVSPPYAGIESEWACQTTNLVLSGGVGTWDDADVSTNARVRFYAAAQRMDSDEDGLTDGMEIFLYRTDPGLADTDGDGWSDAEELAEETDPLDRFSAPRLARGVVINEVLYDDGTAEQRGEWIELYSAGRYPVNLDGFQIEVDDGNFEPVYALSNVWLHAGQALLLGGSEVSGRDQGPDGGFGMPNRGYSGPTAAVRFVATNEGLRVVDCLMYGGNVNNFNSDGLDTTGWISEMAYYAGAGSSLYRRYPGHDTDQAGDWHWTNGPTPQNTNFVFDTDGDGLADEQEWTGSLNQGVPTNPYDPDSDGDGLDDHAECLTHGTDPNAWATDGDLFPWPPASGGVTNWPGSDSYEIAYDWNPLVADQNSNGIPDSWEMAFPGTNIYGHADSDGVTNLTELLQNSNPFDAASSNAQPYVLRFESSIGEWTNGQWQDVGLNGWVKVCFERITTNVDVCLWIVEGSNSEPFTATWDGVADGTVTMVDDQNAFATASLSPGTNPSLLVKDNGAHPNYTNHLGGEYKIDIIKVESVDVHSSDTNTHKIASNLGTHSNHFVCVKDTGDIILDAVITPTNAADAITWEADGTTITSPAAGTDKTTAKLSSADSKRIPVRIKVGSSTCWEGLVWVVWSSWSAPVVVSTTASGTAVGDPDGAGPRPSTNWCYPSATRYRFVASVSPASIISDSDRPNLEGAKSQPVPGGASFQGGATKRWDISRRTRTKILDPAPTTIVRNDYWGYYGHEAGLDAHAGDFPGASVTIVDFPATQTEGNDDQGAGDEDNNPYSNAEGLPDNGTFTAAVGQLASTDKPDSPYIRLDAGNTNETIEVRFQFGEFLRLQIGDAGAAGTANWYRISDYSEWQTIIRYKRQAGGMTDNGSEQRTDNTGW